jgi:uncharacterized RDD family membrane protein YckC
VGGGLTPARAGRRVAALLLDVLVVLPVALAVDALLGLAPHHLFGAGHPLSPHDRRIQLEVGIALSVAYYAGLLAAWNGQTAGKRLLGVRVVRADGRPVSFARAVWRETGVRIFLLGGLAGLLGRVGAAYGTAGFVADGMCLLLHPERRALHDLIAGTRVILADRPSRAG